MPRLLRSDVSEESPEEYWKGRQEGAEQEGLEALRQGGNLRLIQSARHRCMELRKEQQIKLDENKLIFRYELKMLFSYR